MTEAAVDTTEAPAPTPALSLDEATDLYSEGRAEEAAAEAELEAVDAPLAEPEEDDAEDDDGELEADAEDGDEAEDDLFEDLDVPPELAERAKEMQRAWTRKTQALAEERRAAAAEYQAATGERQVYGALLGELGVLAQQDMARLATVDWEGLKRSNPQEYILKRQEVADLQARAQAVHAEQQRLRGQATDQLRQTLLTETFPHWQDGAQMTAETQAMADAARALGFNEQDMAETLDPRAWKLLWKAAQYDRLRAAGAAAKAGKGRGQVDGGPQPVRVLKASGPRPSRTASATRVKALKAKAFKSGSLEDVYQAYRASRRAG